MRRLAAALSLAACASANPYVRGAGDANYDRMSKALAACTSMAAGSPEDRRAAMRPALAEQAGQPGLDDQKAFDATLKDFAAHHDGQTNGQPSTEGLCAGLAQLEMANVREEGLRDTAGKMPSASGPGPTVQQTTGTPK